MKISGMRLLLLFVLVCTGHAEVAVVSQQLLSGAEQRNIRKQLSVPVRFITRHRSILQSFKDGKTQAIILPPCYSLEHSSFQIDADLHRGGMEESYYLISYGNAKLKGHSEDGLSPQLFSVAEMATVGLLDEYGRKGSVSFIDGIFPGLKFRRIIISPDADSLQTMLGLEVAKFLIVRKSQYEKLSKNLRKTLVVHAESQPVPWARLATLKDGEKSNLPLREIVGALELQIKSPNKEGEKLGESQAEGDGVDVKGGEK